MDGERALFDLLRAWKPSRPVKPPVPRMWFWPKHKSLAHRPAPAAGPGPTERETEEAGHG